MDSVAVGSPGAGSEDILLPGTRLGRYQLLLPVGRGGMAQVWAARLRGERGFSKLVAIKTILPGLADETDFQRMLLDEAHVASRVQHPNVCAVNEVGEAGALLFLVMEWVNGDSFAKLLKKGGPLDAGTAARLVADACAGLHAAHELEDDQGHPLDVVHRDATPHNILVSLDGCVKVADFGIARSRGQLHQATHAGQVKGKLSYLAPEALGRKRIDRRADVFTMGCVLYEAIAGKRAFRGDGEGAVLHAIANGHCEPIEEVTGGRCPAPVATLVRRALDPDPARRFQTADEMRQALEEWLADSGARAGTAHLARLVHERLGRELAQRQERIRAAVASVGDGESTSPAQRRAETQTLDPASHSTSVPSVEPTTLVQVTPPAVAAVRTPTPVARRRLGRVGTALVLAFLVAAGVIRATRPSAKTPSVAGSAKASAAEPTAQEPAATPTESAAPAAEIAGDTRPSSEPGEARGAAASAQPPRREPPVRAEGTGSPALARSAHARTPLVRPTEIPTNPY